MWLDVLEESEESGCPIVPPFSLGLYRAIAVLSLARTNRWRLPNAGDQSRRDRYRDGRPLEIESCRHMEIGAGTSLAPARGKHSPLDPGCQYL